MNLRWLMVLALGAAVVKPAASQVSVYADFSAAKLTGGIQTVTTNVLYGPTFGVTAQLGQKAHLKLSADVRAGFYGDSQKLDQVAFGPKVGLPVKKFEVYMEALVGFARYNDGLGHSTSSSTDGQFEVNAGVDRRITQRFDWRIFELGYEQYYGLGGEFNPKTFSTGVVYHLGSR